MEARGTGGRTRLPLAIGVVVVAAGAATFLLWPRNGVIEPAAVDAQSYFTPQQLQRAEDFRGLQRWIGAGGLVVSTGALALLAARPPRLLDRLGRRPILGAAAAAAGISLMLVVVDLPLSAWAQQRSRDVGLSTQAWPDWLGDVAKSAAIGAVFAAAGGALAIALVRRFPRRWWAPAAVLVTAFGVITIWLFPVVIDPLFNKFEKLPPGPTRADVLELAREAGVKVGQVYRVDASRRTTAANAYVTGLGRTKRVVLFDTLLGDFPPAEVRSVVAHELSHVRHRDVQRALAWLGIVAPAALHLVQRLTEQLTPPTRKRKQPGPEILPALVLTLGAVSFAGNTAVNALSRMIENRADKFALDLTEDPDAFIELERRLAIKALAEPEPPRILQKLFGSHPSTLERIGYGLAWKKTSG
jgi:Zn-dependent protease with chaperone function